MWLACVLVVAYLLGWPLVMNEWARRRWDEVPCRVTSAGYNYMKDGSKYMASRRDFWVLKYVNDKARQQNDVDPNDHCWVNPSDPHDAVLRLDAWTHWENSTGRVASAAVVVAVVTMMTIAGRKKHASGAGGVA
jgi:hypothetical protein